jgi:hypothetical protein
VLALLATAVLLAGAGVYVFDRPPTSFYLTFEWLATSHLPPLFGAVGWNLPSFAHAFGFSILTTCAISEHSSNQWRGCAIWFVLDSGLEAGQTKLVAAQVDKLMPDWFDGMPVLENVARFFTEGRFDSLDLAAVLAGCIAAWIVLSIVRGRG